ncbi:MAG TPA: hypothetical protein DCG69_01175 [Bacteroidales bacterium]|nr:hypothetical protein [Bacteroidales bacterium]
MLEFEKIERPLPANFVMSNLLLLAGAGQNVGKTSFGVACIQYLKRLNYKVYALKITPHFHSENPAHLIVQEKDFQISLEKDINGSKDSSRLLRAGADEVFFVQTKSDQALAKAFNLVSTLADNQVLWVCESGGLREIVEPGLFLYFKMKDQFPIKASAQRLIPLANRIVAFDGINFDFSPEEIQIQNHRFCLK